MAGWTRNQCRGKGERKKSSVSPSFLKGCGRGVAGRGVNRGAAGRAPFSSLNFLAEGGGVSNYTRSVLG